MNDAVQTADTAVTSGDAKDLITDDIATIFGLLALGFNQLPGAPGGAAVAAAFAAAGSAVANVQAHGVTGDLDTKHVVSAASNIMNALALAQALGANVPIPHIRAMALALTILAFGFKNWDKIPSSNADMAKIIQDFDRYSGKLKDEFLRDSSDKLKKLIDEMRDYFNASKQFPVIPVPDPIIIPDPIDPDPFRTDPLVFDLDGDGTETTSLKDGAYFDHGGDGFTEQTGWVGRDDGLLVWDRNNDGRINGGTELFGDNTILKNGLSGERYPGLVWGNR